MRALVYVSQALVPFDADALKALAERAANDNAKPGLTGYLFHDRGHFVQYLEGEAAAIDGLMARIQADPRHRVLRTLVEEPLAARRFPGWGMRAVTPPALGELRLEHLLSDYLRLNELLRSDEARWRAGVLRMVDDLAACRRQLGAGTAAA